MDAVAERGIVAEWQGQAHDVDRSHGWRSLSWLAELMDWQVDVQDPHEFIESVKADLFADEVYVFTPRGDVFTFRRGATPIDFASRSTPTWGFEPPGRGSTATWCRCAISSARAIRWRSSRRRPRRRGASG
jgi:(p)ppGpp synthase/HD superfamily hydrolase